MLELPFYEVDGTLNFTAERARNTVRGCQMQKELLKQDQSGILAQIFLLCGKLRREYFRESLFRTPMHRAVKCRDSNCRGDGAARVCGGCEKNINHEGHEGSRRFCWGRFPSCYFVSFVVKGFRIHPYLTESRFGGIAQGDLYLRFALTLSKESGAATFHAQAYIPT